MDLIYIPVMSDAVDGSQMLLLHLTETGRGYPCDRFELCAEMGNAGIMQHVGYFTYT